jgi:hypothetical protein
MAEIQLQGLSSILRSFVLHGSLPDPGFTSKRLRWHHRSTDA